MRGKRLSFVKDGVCIILLKSTGPFFAPEIGAGVYLFS